MKKSTAKKSWIMTAIIYAIVFAVFNLLVFVIAKEKNGVFWMSYAFMCLAFVIQIVSMLLALRTLETETVFMGIPLAFAAIFVGAVFMFFQNAPFKLALVLQVLVLAVYVIVAILALMSRDVVQDVNDNLKENVEAIKTLTVDVDVFIPQVNDPALKKALKKLSETIKYSDPMSNAAVADIEDQIMQTVNELRINIENSRNTEAIQTCKDIEVLFMQRNSLLKATK